ncbi:MAG: prepilin-type N-terminal cleavage/methylation domain-containing protein [Patescibacteria group bacterium]
MKKGFTLIELLVVISIISLLSSVVLSSISSARAKARDAQKIASLKQIQNAIELYAADNNGNYPSGVPSTYARSQANATESECGYSDGSASYTPGVWCQLESRLAPYIKSLPRTAVIGSTYYSFYYKIPYQNNPTYNPNNINMYGLGVYLEVPNRVSQNDGGYYSNMYEIGELPRYCKQQAVAAASNWVAWAAIPCSCAVYYTTDCGY